MDRKQTRRTFIEIDDRNVRHARLKCHVSAQPSLLTCAEYSRIAQREEMAVSIHDCSLDRQHRYCSRMSVASEKQKMPLPIEGKFVRNFEKSLLGHEAITNGMRRGDKNLS